jgi:2,3-bisphosphoglycerate-independent phosphoglycerate mutase
MKGVLVIIDGMGDLPCRILGDKTPLEAANMPNLDFLSAPGEMGYMYSVRPGFVPESDEAIVSIFGNDVIASTRGQLEARGVDLDLTRGDLALRANFATIDSLEKKNIIDRRVGRTLTTAEAEVLAKAINKIEMPYKFIFKPTVQHRGALVFRGGFSDNFTGNDSTYIQGRISEVSKIGLCRSLDDEENSQYTVNVVNEFLEKAYSVLKDHPINQARERRGLLPANYLLVRGAGVEIPRLIQYKNWFSTNYMPLEIGFSKVSGMENYSFEYPKLKNNDSYQNLWDGLKEACAHNIKFLKKYSGKYSYGYIHFKEVDIPGHDNKPIEKKEMLEYIDQTFFKFLREFAPPNQIKVVVTADHSTPCKLKAHSADFVPVLFYNMSPAKPQKFSEKEARLGSLGGMNGNELLSKVGFAK